ncbi:AI-2E family transporter [Cupriavidus basilensis]|uniref:AI-2E family transporter n=1 Tax=Cupriavidus basilensis TaxID=68895 RepID=A0ABT6AYV5_9BURK|nr:AI-2E family transporter [Cupriavidus basilensis]MDF3837800.1 AI-2E family transporter [Cupriavidus basilensis]
MADANTFPGAAGQPSAPSAPPDGIAGSGRGDPASGSAGAPEAGEERAAAAPAIQAPAPTPVIVSDGRGGRALTVLAVLASLYTLHLASAFVIPVVLAVIIAYMLDPMVTVLSRRRVPRAIGASLVLLALLAGVVCCAYLLQDQIAALVDRLPEVAAKLSRSVSALLSGNDSMLQKIRRAATVLGGTAQAPHARGSQIVVERAGDPVNNMLLAGSLGIFAMAAQAAVVLFLAFFMLVSGDMFKRKFVKMAGTTLTQKKISVHMLDEINRQIQRYMVMLLVTNAMVGLLTWILLKWLQLDNAGTLALAAAALHLVPYFGAVLIAGCIGLAAFMQSGGFGLAALAAGGSLLIATLVGSLLTTWMTGRMAKMNAVAVFVMLLLFTWLWGAWGVLLAIPIAVIAKVVADHVEGMELLAEFLGE